MQTFLIRRAVRGASIVGIAVVLMTELGCSDFAERSVSLDPSTSVRLSTRPAAADGHCSTRVWLTRTHKQIAPLLPPTKNAPLITEQLTNGDGRAIDVFAHFGIRPDDLQSLVKNFRGLRYSAQAASRDYCIDCKAPPWPGFEDVWIPMELPVNLELQLSGRLGYARDEQGNIKDADCIVILPGLFGDHGVKRSADLAIPLLKAGFHVLHLEIRGHGQTEARYPKIYHTFGTTETDDLMQVHDWLVKLPHVRRTGLVSYCWNANIALYAAWYDGRPENDGIVTPALKGYLRHYDHNRRRFTAGVIAFSPVVRWEVLMDELDTPRSRWKHPIFAAIQDTIRDRQKRKSFEVSASLRRLVEEEYLAQNCPLPGGVLEGYPFMRLIEYKGHAAGDKLDKARMPVLIVAGADDPLVPCQDIADLMATVHSPNVGALILPTGGHVGFGQYAPNYYLSLITNFFDPVTGPAARAKAE